MSVLIIESSLHDSKTGSDVDYRIYTLSDLSGMEDQSRTHQR